MTTYVRETGVPEGVDGSLPIWRYQDLAKLLWTLSTGSLWFARADTLGDPFEGSSTKALNEGLKQAMHGVANLEQMIASMSTTKRASVRNAAVNCWHVSEHESAAMWRLYVAGGQGIAFRSTIDRLVRSFPEGKAAGAGRDDSGAANVLGVEFGFVRYIDHWKDAELVKGPLILTDPFFLKRKSFEHEHEFRALVFDLPIHNGTIDWECSAFPGGGVAVPIDLEMLVEAIYVAPGAPPWFRQVVESAVERLGARFRVVQSRLDEDPIF